ncbi:MAG: hypothetical protein JWN30_1397 [Bacilli bacterium]|nr:hypothetical protein [Bacilli bacterium]
MLDRNELWAQASELGQLLTESPQVVAFKAAQAALENKPAIKNLMNRLQEMQEQYQSLSQYGSGPHLKGLEESIQAVLKELDQYPEVQTYKEAMHDVDVLLKEVTQLLASTLSENASPRS